MSLTVILLQCNRVKFKIQKKLTNELLKMSTAKTSKVKGKTKKTQSIRSQLTPTAQAASVLSELYNFDGDKKELATEIKKELDRQTEQIKSGDLSSVEEILIAQLNIVNGMITHYSIKLNGFYSQKEMILKYPKIIEGVNDLLAKLFNTSVKLARALADLKRPKSTTFVKQYVDKQLNQLLVERDLQNNQTNQTNQTNSKTLEEGYGTKMDGRTEREAETVNTEVETLGTQYRAENNAG